MKDSGSDIPLKTRWLISSVCFLLLVIDIALKIPQQHGFGSFEAVLVLAGLAPWLAGAIEEIAFGGARLKLRVDRNESDIKTLKFLVELAISNYELRCLFFLKENRRLVTNTANYLAYEGAFKPSILRLRGMGLVKNKRDTGFPDLEREPKGERDGRDYFKITERGLRYLEEYQSAVGHTLRAEAFDG
jgi:hypothetical protein